MATDLHAHPFMALGSDALSQLVVVGIRSFKESLDFGFARVGVSADGDATTNANYTAVACLDGILSTTNMVRAIDDMRRYFGSDDGPAPLWRMTFDILRRLLTTTSLKTVTTTMFLLEERTIDVRGALVIFQTLCDWQDSAAALALVRVDALGADVAPLGKGFPADPSYAARGALRHQGDRAR